MPRTHHPAVPTPQLASAADSTIYEVELARFSLQSLDFPHCWFLPLHYEPGYSYPLIVWLHRAGQDERQLTRVMPAVSMRNYLAVAPRGVSLPGNDPLHETFGWSETDAHIQQAEQRIFECIEIAMRQYSVNQRRIFLAGFDTGGTMALRVAMNHPDRFAGVISLGGHFPTGQNPFGNLLAARRLGILLASGRASEEYTSDQICGDLRLLHTAGLSVTLRQYPCGHELSPQMLADVDRWLIEQITRATQS
jgi:phospholipase/carboxylesterase